MKLKILVLAFSILGVNSFAQPADPMPVAPAAATSTETIVAVPSPAAPPEWAQTFIMTIEKIPGVGPVLTKGFVYLGILTSILTGFLAFLLSALSALSGVLNLAGLASLSSKIQLFRDGKFMYWLKFFSIFNAKKPESDPTKIVG